jgi:nucleoside-diphosphate-sugar epimerase
MLIDPMTDTRLLVTGGSGFIGTHLVESAARRKSSVLNLDLHQPRLTTHAVYWQQVDLLDVKTLTESVRDFRPTHVVHLAARTDMEGAAIADYAANTIGTSNLLQALTESGSVCRVVFASTQYVCGPGAIPESDTTYSPHTIYGESKVDMERRIRATEWPFVWTIVRPTNVWGPHHSRYPREFWKVLHQGRYLHPGSQPVIRSYGFVGNVVEQMLRVFLLPAERVDRRTYYVGDPPIVLLDWVSEFSRAVVGRDPRVVPRAVVRAVALLGDVLSVAGVSFPLTSSRYRSMTEDYPTPMEDSLATLGEGSTTLPDGVRITVDWLRESQGWDV